jgi:Uma2 family endonuclease
MYSPSGVEGMYQGHPPASAAETLPTMYDLPSESPEEMGLPDEFHDFQPKLLRETCRPPACDEFFIGADLNLYYDTKHTGWYKRPDWFLVLGAPASQTQDDLRLSYVMWQEGVAPFLVVELLSPGTEAEDLGQTLRVVGKPPTKWQVYEQILRVPYYVLFDRYTNQLRFFAMQKASYQEQEITGQGIWFDELKLGLGVWDGIHGNVEGLWLRWYDRNGAWVPTNFEQSQLAEARAKREQQRADEAQQRADEEQQRADEAEQRASDAEQRAERLAAQLRELGAQLRELGIEPS